MSIASDKDVFFCFSFKGKHNESFNEEVKEYKIGFK